MYFPLVRSAERLISTPDSYSSLSYGLFSKHLVSTHWWWRLRYNLYYCLAFLQLSQFIWLCIIKPSQYSKVFDEIYYNQFPVTAHSHLLRFHEIIQFRYLTISSQKVKTVCKIFVIVLYDKSSVIKFIIGIYEKLINHIIIIQKFLLIDL